jgi:two-component sensor histidine kinase/CHASE3 domain sensor protein
MVAEASIQKRNTRAARRARPRLAVLASLALVVLAAAAALIMTAGIDRQLVDVTQTYEVRNQARELTIALTEAESSQRGFILTRDQSYLEPYRRAVAGIDTRIKTLIAITANDAQQADRVATISDSITIKLAEMARTVDLIQSDRPGEAQTLIESGMGARLMDELRGGLEQFIGEENAKLLDRNKGIDLWRRSLVGAIIVALAGAAILSYSLLSRTQRQVSALAESRTQLLTQNEALEAEVRERTQAIDEAREHAEYERQRVEALLRDTNHRVGNSLATVSSLLGLQLMRTSSGEVREALEAARARVHAVASAHRRLRLGDDLETVSAAEFLTAVLDDLNDTATSAKAVKLTGDFAPVEIGARDATTIGILVGELVTNALKHAFPDGRAGNIEVSFKRDSADVPTLRVADDGVGMDAERTPGEGGLGSVIVKQLANQFSGVPQYERGAKGGIVVTVPLPGIDRATADDGL